MAKTPETPTPSLAERMDRFRIVTMADGHRSIVMNPPLSDEDRTAAAAQLRQLDRIKRNTLWDPEDIPDLTEQQCRDAYDAGIDPYCYDPWAQIGRALKAAGWTPVEEADRG